MPNRNYIAGRAREYQTIKKLREQGYTCLRASGSHGVFDVVAWNEVHLRFIQCKKQDKANNNIDSVYGDDVAKIRLEKVPKGSKKELWVYLTRKGVKVYEID